MAASSIAIIEAQKAENAKTNENKAKSAQTLADKLTQKFKNVAPKKT